MGPRARGRRARRGGRGRGQAKNQFSRGGGGAKSVKAVPATFIEIDSVESSGDEGVDISNVIDTSDLTILDEVTDNSNDEENADEKLNLNTSETAEGIRSNGTLADPTKEENESEKIEQSSSAGNADTTEPNASSEDVSDEGTEANQETQEEEQADDDYVETSAAKAESTEAPEELKGEDKIEKDGLADENLVDEEDNCLNADEDQGITGKQEEQGKEDPEVEEVEEVEYIEEEEEYVEEEDGEEYVEIVEEVEEEEEEEYVEEEEEEEAVEGLEEHEVGEQEKDESLAHKKKEESEKDTEEEQNEAVDKVVVDLKGKLDSEECKPLEEESEITKGMETKIQEMENQSKNNKTKNIEEKDCSADNLEYLDKNLVKDVWLNQNNDGEDMNSVETEKNDVEEPARIKRENEVNAKDSETLESGNYSLEDEEAEAEEEEEVEYEEEEEEYVTYVEEEEEEVIEEEEEVIEEEELIDGEAEVEEEWVEEEEEEEIVDKIQEGSEVKEGNKEITDVEEVNEKKEEKPGITSEASTANVTETNKEVEEKLHEPSTDVQPASESLSKEELTDKIKDVDQFTDEATEEFDEEATEEFDEEAEMEVLEEANGEGEENEEGYVEGEEEVEYVEGEEEEEYIEVEGDEEVEYEEVEEVEMEEEEEEEVEYVEEIIEEIEEIEEENNTQMPESEDKQDESKGSSNNKLKDVKEDKDVTETAQKEAVTKEAPQKGTVRKEFIQNEAIKKTEVKAEVKDEKLKEKQKSNGNEDCPILVLESSDEEESEAQKTSAQANTQKRKKGSTIEINIKTDNLDKFKPASKKLLVKVEKKVEKDDMNSTEPVKKDLKKVSKPGDINAIKKPPNLAVKKNLNALEKLMKSGDWKLMDETTESEKDTKLKQTLSFKKPFIRGVQEGRPAVYDLILAAKEPLLGLEYIVEVWKEDGKAPPRYFCSLCIYLLTHEELIKHLNHVSHKGNYLNLHARECWSRFPRSQPSKWSHEYVVALERVCTLMEENNMRRLTMLITSKRTYDMYLGRIHHQADQLAHFYLPDTWRNIFTELKLDDPRKDDHPRPYSKEKKEERKYSGEDHWMSSSTRSAPNKSKRSPPRRSRTPEKRRRFSRSRSRTPTKRSRLDSPLSRKRSSSPSPYFNRNKRSKSPYDKFRSTKKRYRSRSRSPRRRSRSRSGSHSRRRRSPSFSRSRKRYSRSVSRSRSRSRSPNMRSRSPVRSHLHKKDIPFRPKEAQQVLDSSKREETGFVPGTFKKVVHVASVKKLELNKAFNPLVSLSSSSIEENIYKTLQNFMKPSETPVHSSDNPRMHATSIPSPVKEKRLQLYKPPPSVTNISTSSIYTSSKNLSDEPNYTIKRVVTTKEVFPSAQKMESYTSSQQEYSSQSKPTNFPSLKYVPLEPSINQSSRKPAEEAEKWLKSLAADVPKASRSRSNLKPVVLVDNPISSSTSTKPVSSKSAYQSATNSLAAIKQIYSTKDRESFTNPSKPDIYPQEELLSSKSGSFSSSSAKRSLQVSSNPALKLSTQTGLSDSARKSRSIPYQMTEETKKEFIDFMCKIQSAPKIEEKARAGIFATTKKSSDSAEKWLKTFAAAGGQTAATTSVGSKGESVNKNKKSSNFWDSWMERHDENEEQTLPSASKEIPGRKDYSVNAFGNVKHLPLRNMETSALGYEMSKYQEGTHKRSAMHPDPFRNEKSSYISCDQSRRDESDPEDWLYRQEQQAWGEQPEYEEQTNLPWRPPQQQQQQQQQQQHHHQLVPTPMPSEPQEDVTSVAQKLNSTLNRILKDYKPTGGLFSAPKLNEPPKERTYQPAQHSPMPNAPVVGNPVEKVNIAGNIAATLTKMGLTNVTQEQLVKIVHELGLLPSGFTAAEASNRIMSTLNANMPSNDGPYRYQHY